MKVSKLSEVPRQSMSRATKFFHGAEHVSRQGLTDESEEVSVNIIHFDHGAHTRMHNPWLRSGFARDRGQGLC